MSKKEKKTNGAGYIMMPPKKLRAHPSNEKFFGNNNSRYDELFESIRINGYLPQYPLTCAKEGATSFVIICGHRRWKAACEQDIQEIPVIARQDVAVDSIDAEKLMIEDNLHRPLQWRTFSDLERYMLALKLKDLYARKRGGDRRSQQFLASRHGDANTDLAIDDITKIVGMSKRYMSMLSVATGEILKDIMESSPALLGEQSVYDQIKTAIDNNLSEDLTALAQSEVPVYKVYKKYRKKNSTPERLQPQDDINVTDNQIEEHITFGNVVTSLLKYFESQFDNKEIFSEAAYILSQTPEEQTKQIKLLHKALNSVIQKMSMTKTRNEKSMEEPKLFSVEEIKSSARGGGEIE